MENEKIVLADAQGRVKPIKQEVKIYKYTAGKELTPEILAQLYREMEYEIIIPDFMFEQMKLSDEIKALFKEEIKVVEQPVGINV